MATKLNDQVDPAALYDEDFYAWAGQQAATLRRLQASHPTLPLDFAHLIEEVEDLAKGDLRVARSQLRRLVEHLLKAEYSPADRPRQQRLKSVDNARSDLGDISTASIVKAVETDLDALHSDGRDAARLDLAGFGEAEAVKTLSAACPYSFDQISIRHWYPSNRHGHVAEPM